MSYCPNCGRQILDESLGCPVCNVRNNIDPTKKPVPTEQTDEYKEGDSFREEAKAEQAETVDSFTVEEADGKTHHFETNEETGDAEYKKKNTVDADAKIPTAIKVLVIVLIVFGMATTLIILFISKIKRSNPATMVLAGVALSKSPSEDYRHFGKTMMTVSIVMLVLSFICCVLGTAAGAFSNIMYETF